MLYCRARRCRRRQLFNCARGRSGWIWLVVGLWPAGRWRWRARAFWPLARTRTHTQDAIWSRRWRRASAACALCASARGPDGQMERGANGRDWRSCRVRALVGQAEPLSERVCARRPSCCAPPRRHPHQLGAARAPSRPRPRHPTPSWASSWRRRKSPIGARAPPNRRPGPTVRAKAGPSRTLCAHQRRSLLSCRQPRNS